MARCSLRPGHTCGASSTDSMRPASRMWPAKSLSGWPSYGRSVSAFAGRDLRIAGGARQEQSTAIIADLGPFWEKELSHISGKSKLAEAICYARSRREALERFLDDGRLDIDSNAVERAIRPQAITSKNVLFAGSDGGGKTSATIATLLQAAKMNDAGPFAWLSLTLQRIAAGWQNREFVQLLPFNHHDG